MFLSTFSLYNSRNMLLFPHLEAFGIWLIISSETLKNDSVSGFTADSVPDP